MEATISLQFKLNRVSKVRFLLALVFWSPSKQCRSDYVAHVLPIKSGPSLKSVFYFIFCVCVFVFLTLKLPCGSNCFAFVLIVRVQKVLFFVSYFLAGSQCDSDYFTLVLFECLTSTFRFFVCFRVEVGVGATISPRFD